MKLNAITEVNFKIYQKPTEFELYVCVRCRPAVAVNFYRTSSWIIIRQRILCIEFLLFLFGLVDRIVYLSSITNLIS